MGIEQKINYQLNKYPVVKKTVKSIYQHLMYAISPKIKSEGNIVRISPDDKDHEYFFGYYDKSPWDATDRYVLCLKANNTWSDVSPKEKAEILLIDTEKEENSQDRVRLIAETNAWNVQQSCMLQWLGPDYSKRIIYNDYRNGKYCSVILTLSTMEERIIPAPVYTVSEDGKFALTLDFSRLYELCPGYGYYNVPEKTKGVALPDATSIWTVDLETGEVKDLLKYIDFANFEPRPEMQEKGTIHKVNHIMLSPNGKRFMVLYRWFNGQRKYTRLITCNIDGTDMYVLSDNDMVSHCFWKDNQNIIAFENKEKSGIGYYLMKDKTDNYYHCWPELTGDGHPSFSPDRKLIVTDTYPNRSRIASIKIMNGDVRKQNVNTVAKVFAPFKYDNDTRCDLHPRWNHGGNRICFDSVYEGHRGLYYIDVYRSVEPKINENVDKNTFNSNPKYSVITPMYNSFSLMNLFFDSFEHQTFKDFEILIVDDCSTDESYEKAVDYAQKSDLSISVIKSDKNSGPGNSRNIGISNAKGDWIVFVDSDDYVETSLFEDLNEKCQNYNDIVLFDYNKVLSNKVSPCQTIAYQHEEYVEKEHAMLWATTNVCGKVYKTRLIKENGIQFPMISRFEDWVFFVKSIGYAHKIVYINHPYYNYVNNSNSLVHTHNVGISNYSMKALNILEKSLSVYSDELVEALYVRELIYVAAKEQLTHYNVKKIKKVVSYVEKKYPHWRKNPYIKKFTKTQQIIIKIVALKLYIIFKILGKLK